MIFFAALQFLCSKQKSVDSLALLADFLQRVMFLLLRFFPQIQLFGLLVAIPSSFSFALYTLRRPREFSALYECKINLLFLKRIFKCLNALCCVCCMLWTSTERCYCCCRMCREHWGVERNRKRMNATSNNAKEILFMKFQFHVPLTILLALRAGPCRKAVLVTN